MNATQMVCGSLVASLLLVAAPASAEGASSNGAGSDANAIPEGELVIAGGLGVGLAPSGDTTRRELLGPLAITTDFEVSYAASPSRRYGGAAKLSWWGETEFPDSGDGNARSMSLLGLLAITAAQDGLLADRISLSGGVGYAFFRAPVFFSRSEQVTFTLHGVGGFLGVAYRFAPHWNLGLELLAAYGQGGHDWGAYDLDRAFVLPRLTINLLGW